MSEVDTEPTDTEFSILSGDEAREIVAKAELLRKKAWDEEAQKHSLKERLDQAVLQRKFKDAFLLRRQIETLEAGVEKLHRSAARRYFRAGNLSNKDDVVDVHGLFIHEAVKKVESSLHTAILNGRTGLKVIVGRGLHSKGGRAKLRPAIMEAMQR
ncbi:hypothetical protein GGX14DRAFT_439904 [Mycena pura]|uniref:Smr domain-containing protein n=1 Tax=Mycena pura TaxID=153505 RepID=A0AAD6VSC7_9AGAR|nr:hypothetical protein GGX14DRAFT_439904 [Mycena pura]